MWEELLDNNQEVHMNGDLNPNQNNWNNDILDDQHERKQRVMINMIKDRILVKNVTRSLIGNTYFSGNKSSAIDHVYSNNPTKMSAVKILSDAISDHLPIYYVRYTKTDPKLLIRKKINKKKSTKFTENYI